MNTEIRRKDRAITDKNEIRSLVDRVQILHLGLMDGEYPYIVPLHYGYEYEEEADKYIFYIHGAKEGHKLDLIRSDSHVFVELETDVELVPGENACSYGAVYTSFMGRGYASILEDPEEKVHGLSVLMKHQTGRDFEMTEKMAQSVSVIKVEVEKYTGKARKKQ